MKKIASFIIVILIFSGLVGLLISKVSTTSGHYTMVITTGHYITTTTPGHYTTLKKAGHYTSTSTPGTTAHNRTVAEDVLTTPPQITIVYLPTPATRVGHELDNTTMLATEKELWVRAIASKVWCPATCKRVWVAAP